MANGTLKVENIQTSSGSGTITIGQSGETVAFGSGVTSKMNHPAFQVYLATNTDLSDNTSTTVPYETVQFDTGNFYDTSTYLYTPTVAGKYFVYTQILVDASNGFYYTEAEIMKNGAAITGGTRLYSQYENTSNTDDSMERMPHSISGIVEMNGTTDYLNGRIYTFGGNAATIRGDITYFGAYRIGVE